jgi:hypothetical protein
MGASFLTETLDGKLKQAQVTEKFRQLQDRCRVEDGSSYSGGWNMLHGIRFPMGENHPLSEEQAEEWLSKHCEKWEDALAIRATIRHVVGKPTFTPPAGMKIDEHGFDGMGKAWRLALKRAANYEVLESKVVPADSLKPEDKERLAEAVRARYKAERENKVTGEALFRAVQMLQQWGELLPEFYANLPKVREDRLAAAKAYKAAQNAVQELDERLGEPLIGYKDEVVWMLGGWCAS